MRVVVRLVVGVVVEAANTLDAMGQVEKWMDAKLELVPGGKANAVIVAVSGDATVKNAKDALNALI